MSILSGIEIYDTRSSRAWCGLSDAWFAVLNTGRGVDLQMVGGGCLDAPDQLPCGSVKAYGSQYKMVKPSIAQRTEDDERTLAEREAIADQIISEILAEEAARSVAQK